MANHHLKQHPAVDRSLGTPVSPHTPGITPLHTRNNTTRHPIAEPRHASEKNVIHRHTQICAGQGLKTDTTSMLHVNPPYVDASSLAHLRERRGRQGAMRQFVDSDEARRDVLETTENSKRFR